MPVTGDLYTCTLCGGRIVTALKATHTRYCSNTRLVGCECGMTGIKSSDLTSHRRKKVCRQGRRKAELASRRQTVSGQGIAAVRLREHGVNLTFDKTLEAYVVPIWFDVLVQVKWAVLLKETYAKTGSGYPSNEEQAPLWAAIAEAITRGRPNEDDQRLIVMHKIRSSK